MSFCPICGQDVSVETDVVANPGGTRKQHRCPPNVLRGIDSQLSREDYDVRQPTFGERLAEAERMKDPGGY